jgi:hypothetical protein
LYLSCCPWIRYYFPSLDTFFIFFVSTSVNVITYISVLNLSHFSTKWILRLVKGFVAEVRVKNKQEIYYLWWMLSSSFFLSHQFFSLMDRRILSLETTVIKSYLYSKLTLYFHETCEFSSFASMACNFRQDCSPTCTFMILLW